MVDGRKKIPNIGHGAVFDPVQLHIVMPVEVVTHHREMSERRFFYKLQTDHFPELDLTFRVEFERDLSGYGLF